MVFTVTQDTLAASRRIERRERIAKDLTQYIEAIALIEWLQENKLVDSSLNGEALAYQYAIRYSNQKENLDDIMLKTS